MSTPLPLPPDARPWALIDTLKKVVAGLVLLSLALVALLIWCLANRPRPEHPGPIVPDSVATAPPDTIDAPGGPITPPPQDTLLPGKLPFAGGAGTALAPVPTGLPLGLSGYKPNDWCNGAFDAGFLGMDPSSVQAYVRKSAYCGVEIAWSIRDGALHTATGRPFSLTLAKDEVDRLAQALPADTLRKYKGYVLYFNCFDDLGSKVRWSELPSLPDVQTLCRYMQVKLGRGIVPVCIRAMPQQMAAYPNGWDTAVDCGVVQWSTPRGDQQKLYDKNAAFAKTLGIKKMVYTVNVDDCDGNHTDPCTKAELLKYVGLAIDYPDNCASVSFRYNTYTWTGQYKEAWQILLPKAKAKNDRTCLGPAYTP